MSAYYNEVDANKAAWLRELIRENVIAPGEVDERSITDVRADDLRGFAQCHWFAGIGVWSYALRQAGWEDGRECWTGSCPCPSFSAAGKGKGFADARHLWPDWFRLIRECRPAVIFGEQVEAAIGHGWFDLVHSDLENAKYAVGAAVLTAAGVGAPHIRQRLYFVAHAAGRGTPAIQQPRQLRGSEQCGDAGECANPADDGHTTADGLRKAAEPPLTAEPDGEREPAGSGNAGNVPDPDGRHPTPEREQRSGEQRLLAEDCGVGDLCDTNGLRRRRRGIADGGGQEGCGNEAPERSGILDPTQASSNAGECEQPLSPRLEGLTGDVRDWRGPGWLDQITARSVAQAGATRGFWADCDWWWGRDGKWRPIEPGVFPLAHGAANRVLKLRGYGDAINAETAKAFIEACMSLY